MKDDLVLYTHPMSRGRIARWMLEEIGQPYRTEALTYDGAMKSPAYLALNPMGKVPTVVHKGTVVTETAAICAYLADAFPGAGLAPQPGSTERGPYYRWLMFAAGPLEQALTNNALGFIVPKEREKMAGYGNYAVVLDAIDGLLSGQDYVTGDRFSAADLYLGAHIMWGMQFGTLERRPSFERYQARVTSRPAAKRAAEIDDALSVELGLAPGAES